MPNAPIKVNYNLDLSSLARVLAKVDRPGDFYASGTLETPMPRLDIQGVGTISFPVPATQAREIIAQADQAPYGRGEKTIIDTTVRRVWQVPITKVKISGKAWESAFEVILARTAQALGCQKPISAEFYKSLVYETGGFFLPHRDTEKTEGMFGTLVIVLPSSHSGGELLIRHADREVALNMAASEFTELVYAAFYADCQHEIRPVTEGYRLCLIYNLLQKDCAKGSSALNAPDFRAEVEPAAKILKEWSEDKDAPPKLICLLEHQYTPAGLSFATLKNTDAAKAKVLCDAGQKAGCIVHLGIVNIEESGGAEPLYQPSYSRRWGRDRYNDDRRSDSTSSEYSIIEVYDSGQFINNWRDVQDNKIDIDAIPIKEGELFPKGALDGQPPDQQSFTEATGNEGGSFERSYHRAAVVLWSANRHAEIMLQCGVAAGLAYLKKLVNDSESGATSSESRGKLARQISSLAVRLIEAWKEERPYSYARFLGKERVSPSRSEMLQLLQKIGAPDLLARFIEEVVTFHYDGSENVKLAVAAKLLPPKTVGSLTTALFEEKIGCFPVECFDLLKRLTEGAASKRAKTANRNMAAALVENLKNIPVRDGRYNYQFAKTNSKPLDGIAVATLLGTLHRLELDELAETALKSMSNLPAVFLPDKIIIPALEQLNQRAELSAFFDLLWKHAAQFLLARGEFPPIRPPDWAQTAKLSCACEDCRNLKRFAEDPIAQIGRFRVRQDRRYHLQNTISTTGLDMTCETEEIGSPHTLVITKTRRTFNNLTDQFNADKMSIKTLIELAGDGTEKFQPLLGRMKASAGRETTGTV